MDAMLPAVPYEGETPVNSTASMKACGLILILAGAAFLMIGLAARQAALWGAAPGPVALGTVLLALSRSRPA